MTLFLLLWFWLAQQANQPPRHNVTGTVTNALTGEPIQRALVQIWAATSKSTLTGADGRFEFADVPEGSVNFNVTKPGFFSSQTMPGHRSQPLKVGSGTNDFHLLVSPAARVIGRFTDQDGEPVADIPVQLLAQSLSNGRKQWGPRGGGTTDEDGQYRTDDLTAGRYIIFAPGHVMAGNLEGAADVFGPAYYPDAGELGSAQVIELQAGEEFRADFHVRSQHGYSVTGTVENYPANGGSSFSILDASGQHMDWPARFDPKRGQFVIPAVPPGKWTISVMANDPEHTYESAQELAIEHGDVTNIKITLHPDVTIPITVNHAGAAGTPFVNATLFPVEASLGPQQFGAMMQDQRLVFNRVRPGKYRLSVQTQPNECLESAWYGSVDLLRDYLVVSPGAGPQPVIVNFTSECAKLSATITNAGQQSSGFVVIVPASGNQEPITWFVGSPTGAAPDAYGKPGITLSPGTYQVFAFTDVYELEYSNPEVLKQYSSQTIELGAGQKTDISVALIDPNAK